MHFFSYLKRMSQKHAKRGELHCLPYQKWPQRGPNMLAESVNVCTPRFLGPAVNFCYIRFFDPSTPSMRKVDDRGKRRRGAGEIMSFIVATYVVAS